MLKSFSVYNRFLTYYCLLFSISCVSQGNMVKCDIIHEHDGRDMGDKEYFAIIRGAMKVLSFNEDEMWNIWRIVALIMHLGNITFGGTPLVECHVTCVV